MNIFKWSGPRNISTALMRSFENRSDTHVWDEPFYAYYLKKTNINHPLRNKIINKYQLKEEDIIKIINSPPPNNKKIHYLKNMTHHILKKTNINWIKEGKNCFLIRHPKEVILSYIQKNELKNSLEIGFPSQLRLFNKVKKINQKIIVINSKDLLDNPKSILKKLCKKIQINFETNMLKWPKGKRETDGIWSSIWYDNVHKSTSFIKKEEIKYNIQQKHIKIYNECLEIYNILNKYKI